MAKENTVRFSTFQTQNAPEALWGWRKYSVGKVQPFVLYLYDVERSKVITSV